MHLYFHVYLVLPISIAIKRLAFYGRSYIRIQDVIATSFSTILHMVLNKVLPGLYYQVYTTRFVLPGLYYSYSLYVLFFIRCDMCVCMCVCMCVKTKEKALVFKFHTIDIKLDHSSHNVFNFAKRRK